MITASLFRNRSSNPYTSGLRPRRFFGARRDQILREILVRVPAKKQEA